MSCASTDKKDPSEKVVDMHIKVFKATLENGLRVLIVENHNLPIFSYYTFYDVGARYERKGQTGASHFLEHLMFKGAKKYGPGKFDTLIEGNGGSTNAYTTFDSTVYYENLPVKSLEMIIDMEADRTVNLLLDPKTFESERNVVLEERKLRYENSPGGKLYLTMMQKVFKGTPYGGSVIGNKKDVETITRDEVYKYFKKYYAPNNAILIIAGDVDARYTFNMVKRYYGGLPASKNLEKTKAPLDDPKLYAHKTKYPKEVKIYANSPTPQFILAYPSYPMGKKEAFVLDMLSSILGDGESSYLNQKYVQNKKPFLTRIGVSNYTLKHNGVFFISGNLLKNTNLKKFKRRLTRDSKRFCRDGITERALQKTKNQYLIHYYHSLQSNAGVARFLGYRENFFGDYNFYKKEIDIYNSMTVNDVRQACQALFKNNHGLFLSVWNKHPSKKS
jgi:zinc protease